MRPSNKRAAARTTPIFDRIVRARFWCQAALTITVPLLPVLALLWFGQPALRIQYWYNGRSSDPVYERCIYLALDGWHDVRPTGGINAEPTCPLVAFFPADLSFFF